MATSDEQIQRMLMLYMDELPITEIAEAVGVSRPTVYRYKRKGALTDGVDWEDYRERQQKLEAQNQKVEELEAEVEQSANFHNDVIPDLKAAMVGWAKAAKNNPEKHLDSSGFDKIAKTVARYENRGAELQRMNESFATKVMQAVYETVGEETYQLIVARMREIQLDQMKEFDEEYAATLLQSAGADSDE